ncbi:uncharacterized protein LOC106867730 [Octopus bimaculoides]|uniref:EGF-like domain-containing protein n=1 Tax=Octopus bimaculoides TaxID=37653 RepID=A0A0L8HYW4_OCTBM|nr:uncharacterized protein LOC106867730 [Octopus bimaculoides]|eukprot:XP_014768179.1 PREDICTED: uncharacterized protein LOC106867730 [Octopus bimaculoides]
MLTHLSVFCFFIAAISTGDCRSLRSMLGGKNHRFQDSFVTSYAVPECYYDGKIYPVGQIFSSISGECTCTLDNGVQCNDFMATKLPSVHERRSVPPPAPECYYDGKMHPVGQTFSSISGECTCTFGHGIQCKRKLIN